MLTISYLEDQNSKSWTAIKEYLNITFSIKYLGELHYFLDIEVLQTASEIHLTQRKYAFEILTSVGFLESKPISSPLVNTTALYDSSSPFL